MESVGGESADISKRITRTVVTRTNYGSSMSGTAAGGTELTGISGDATRLALGSGFGDLAMGAASSMSNMTSVYDSSMTSDAMLSSTASGADALVAGRLDRVHGDLSSFKKRIDANTEEQREHADLMVGLQHKVEEYRRRIAGIESQIANQKSDSEVVSFNLSESVDAWGPSMNMVTESTIDGRFEDERRRNEELRLQNAQLQTEIQRIRQQFDVTIQDKERSYQIRERNLAQYLSEEQKKMMDLWTELQQVRRQCADYKDQTERDLDIQRNEFAKVMRNIGGVARQLNITSTYDENGAVVQDAGILEALQRFRDQQTGPAGASMDDYDALMKKYEEAIDRMVHMETSGDDSSSKIAALEAELRRAKERIVEQSDVLHKLHELTKESEKQLGKRARSLSPAGGHAAPSQVLRSVRYAIRSRDNEIMQLNRKLKNGDMQINELVARFENAEEARRRLEKQLADSKKDISVQIRAVEDATREVRRLEERLRTSDSEKIVTENARKHLEDEIRRLKLMFDQNAADGERKALEDAENQVRIVEEEYKIRVTELTRRVEALQGDNKRLKGDLADVKDKYRTLEIDYSSTLHKIDEKDQALRHLEDLKGDLLKDLENQRTRFDAVTSELDSLQTNFSTTTKNTVAIEMTVKEIKQQRDDIARQRDDLAKQLTDIMHKMEIEIKRREDVEKASLRHLGEIEKLKTTITDYESQLMMLRRHNDELDTQLKTSQAKISTLEISIKSAQMEIAKLSELNGKLQKEKNDIMNLKQKVDVELDATRDRLRKTEQEVDKLKIENQNLHDNEERAKVALKEETQKVYLLQRELQDAKTEIEELRRRLAQLDQETKDRLEHALHTTKGPGDIYETTEITEVRVRELGDKYKMDLEKLENERDDLLRRVKMLQDELAEKQRTIDRQDVDMAEQKHQYEIEIQKLNTEISNLEIKHRNELDDERDQHAREIEALKAQEDELRARIATLEKKLHDALERQNVLEKEVLAWEEKYDSIVKEIQKVRDELETVRLEAEKEIEKWKTETYKVQTELKEVEATNETLRSQLAIANDRIASLNKTINEHTAKIRELNSTIRRLEEELTDSKSTIVTLEADLEKTTARLHSVEEQYATLQLDNNKLRAEIDSLNRTIDGLKNTNASNVSEIERLRKKVTHITEIAKQQAEELEKVRNERDQLDRAYREKSSMVDRLTETVKTLESKVNRMRQELQTLADKLIAAETERDSLRSEVKKLQQELQFGKDQMQRKTDEFHAALDDLANAHRISEDGRINAVQELETRKFEINDLQSRLDNAEQRLAALQQEYLNADKERDMLNDSLRRFQSIVSRNVMPDGGRVDIQSIDVHVQKMLTRIDRLERERNEYRDSLDRLKHRNGETVQVTTHQNLYTSVEDRISSAQDEKRAAETKLASAKQLLRSQEEALKLRDDERRQMKSKIVAFELETRGKEAQIRHLNEVVKTLRSDLDGSQGQVRHLRDREEQWDTSKVQLESRVRDREGEEQRVKVLVTNFESEKERLQESLRKLASQLQTSEGKNTDLKEDADRLKKDLVKCERVEVELRRSLEEQTRLAREGQLLKDQLMTAHNDLTNANNRKQILKTELLSVRSELRDQKQHFREANSRISDLQRQLQDANGDRSRLNDRVTGLEKTISTLRNTENDLRHQLTAAANDRKTLQNEIDDLRRRLGQFDGERKTIVAKIEELTQIRVTLIKRIEILETEKRSAQALISETASQREEIERSLNALERENKELARNCTQLQQQIVQLEMDNGDRLITLSNKQKEEHDRFVQSIKTEKTQVERTIQNRERACKNRIHQLESQLSMLRGQLNSERMRSRGSDHVYVSDITKVGGAYSGMTSIGGIGGMSGASAYPQTDSFDYVIGNQSAMSSIYSSQQPMTTTYRPSIGDMYSSGTAASTITLQDPAESSSRSQEMISTTYRSSLGQSAGLMSALGERFDPSSLGESDVSKKTTVTTVRTTRSGYAD